MITHVVEVHYDRRMLAQLPRKAGLYTFWGTAKIQGRNYCLYSQALVSQTALGNMGDTKEFYRLLVRSADKGFDSAVKRYFPNEGYVEVFVTRARHEHRTRKGDRWTR